MSGLSPNATLCEAAIDSLRVIAQRRGCKIQQGDVLAVELAVDVLMKQQAQLPETAPMGRERANDVWREFYEKRPGLASWEEKQLFLELVAAALVPIAPSATAAASPTHAPWNAAIERAAEIADYYDEHGSIRGQIGEAIRSVKLPLPMPQAGMEFPSRDGRNAAPQAQRAPDTSSEPAVAAAPSDVPPHVPATREQVRADFHSRSDKSRQHGTPRTDALRRETLSDGLALALKKALDLAHRIEGELAEAHERIDACEAGWAADTSTPSSTATGQLSQEKIERWRDWYHTGNYSEKFSGSFDELCNMALMAALLPDSSGDGGDNFNTTAHALARAFGDLSSRDRYIASMAYSDGRIHALRATPSPIAWMWQHPETGMKGFIEHCSAEDRTHWERMNKPREIVRPVYDHVVRTPSATSSNTAAQLAFDQQSDDPAPGDWNAACRHIADLLREQFDISREGDKP